MARHTEETLGRTRIAQVLDLQLTHATLEARQTVRLVASKNGQVVDLLPALLTVVRTRQTHQAAVSEHQEVQVAAERLVALETLEALDVPAVVAQLVRVPLEDGVMALLTRLGGNRGRAGDLSHGRGKERGKLGVLMY